MESCPDRLNREREEEALAPSESIGRPAQCVQDGLLPKKATAKSYIYPLSNTMETESPSQGNYFAPKGIIKDIAELPQYVSHGGQVRSCFSAWYHLVVFYDWKSQHSWGKNVIAAAVTQVSSSQFALRMLCEDLFLALHWLQPSPQPCPGLYPAPSEGKNFSRHNPVTVAGRLWPQNWPSCLCWENILFRE